MLHSFKNIWKSLFTIVMVLFSIVVPTASAEEIVISGNGSDSVSQVAASTSQVVNANQSNTADIDNNIETTSNTGENSASDNVGGDASISTGDISTTTDVANSANISSVLTSPCNECSMTISTVISGNSPASQNTVNYSSGSQANISVNQIANISNNIVTNANTGNNQANNNLGNVIISTGSITVLNSILNGPINISKVKVSQGMTVDALLKIAGNGTSSLNNINFTINHNKNVSVNNVSDILNNISLNLNTGENSANDNIGNVKITTGDIWAKVKVENLTNISEVIVDCGCKPKPGEENPPILPPGITINPPSTGGGGGGSSSSGGSSAGIAQAIGNMLPSTGTNWLFIALFGNIMMLFLGAFLRLRSGRGPGAALAI